MVADIGRAGNHRSLGLGEIQKLFIIGGLAGSGDGVLVSCGDQGDEERFIGFGVKGVANDGEEIAVNAAVFDLGRRQRGDSAVSDPGESQRK